MIKCCNKIMIVQRTKKRRFPSCRCHFPVLIAIVVLLLLLLLVLVGAFLWNASLLSLLLFVPSESLEESSSLFSLSPKNSNFKENKALLLMMKEKATEITNTNRIPGNNNNSFPLLSDLIEVSTPVDMLLLHQHQNDDNDNQRPKIKTRIKANATAVQFLLDYVIVGFSKCGTTTLLKWIRRDPNVRTFKREIHEIIDNDPGGLVERLYQNLLENPVPLNSTSNTTWNTNTTTTNNNKHHFSLGVKTFLQGFKLPEIIQEPLALRHIHQYWPETKLIVAVRNPMKWFRSFYNFRLTLGQQHLVGNNPNALIGSCISGGRGGRGGRRQNEESKKILCSHMGAFHVKLFRLGKTDMSSPEELNLLEPYLSDDDQDILDYTLDRSKRQVTVDDNNNNNNNNLLPRMKNKIFFIDLRQMSDSNKTRATIFRKDLQSFLGLQHELSPIFRARPFKQLELIQSEESKQYKMKSICDRQYLPLQQELFPMAQKASLWIRQYFLKSPDVIVSSPEYLEELLETWMENPCDVQVT